MNFRNHLLIDSQTRISRNTSGLNKDDEQSYLIVHEEKLSDIANRPYTKSALVRKDKWEIERNGVLRTSVLFVSGFRIIRKLIYSVRSSDRNAWVEAASDQ